MLNLYVRNIGVVLSTDTSVILVRYHGYARHVQVSQYGMSTFGMHLKSLKMITYIDLCETFNFVLGVLFPFADCIDHNFAMSSC